MTSLFEFVTGMRAMIPLAAVISLTPLTDTLAFDAMSIQRIKKSNECQYCDLSWADLSEMDLSYSNLTGANLFLANLSGTDLSNARLEGAILNSTNLIDTNLGRAKLSRAIIIESNIKDAFLCDTQLPSGKLFSDCLFGAQQYKIYLFVGN